MPLKNILFLFVLVLIIPVKAFTQDLEGLYTFYLAENDVQYIKFSGNRFILFSLKHNPSDGRPGLSSCGSGVYTVSGHKFILKFTKDCDVIMPLLSTDSITSSFSSDPGKKQIDILFQVNGTLNRKGTLRVETSTRTFDYILKDGHITVSLPGNTIINSIKFFLVGYDERILPFDPHFNVIRYRYNLNDPGNIVNTVEYTKMEFRIRSSGPEGYRFKEISSLLKTDAKTMEYLNSVSTYDLRVRKILDSLFHL